jgi:hypothetical protein
VFAFHAEVLSAGRSGHRVFVPASLYPPPPRSESGSAAAGEHGSGVITICLLRTQPDYGTDDAAVEVAHVDFTVVVP